MRRDQLGDEGLRIAVALHDPDDALPEGDHRGDVDRDGILRLRGHADQPDHAAGGERAERRLDRIDPAAGVEGEVEAIGDDGAQRFGDGTGFGIDDVGRAEVQRDLAACLNGFDQRDRRAALNFRAHHRGQTDGPAADDRDRAARWTGHRAHHPAGAGLESAAKGPKDFERCVRVLDLHDIARADDRLGGKARLAEEVRGDRLAIGGIGRRPILQPHAGIVQRRKIAAIAGQMLLAARAMAAAGKAEDDTVADRQPLDSLADLFDHACTLMAKHGRQRVGGELVAEDEIGVAQADPGDLDADLAGARCFDRNLLDRECAPGCAGNRGDGLHECPYWMVWRQPLGVWPAYWRKARVK